jgi:hypothetical protein
MKRGIIFLVLFAIIIILFCGTSTSECTDSARQKTEEKQDEMSKKAVDTVEIPTVSYFQERRTISKWTERWDKPSIVTYVYLISFGNIIGYYVADGKPASTRSYLMPEEQYYINGAVLSTPDIDGTYGQNNEGIRFFTAEGTAVEWAGSGASYLYSDALLPINVPKLNKNK